MLTKLKMLRSFAAAMLAVACALAPVQVFAATTAEDVAEWRAKAEQGDADAQFYLGNAYALGEGVAEDWREAVRWYRKAAEQGHAWAQFGLGLAYDFGKGVAEDDREAVRWYRKAAEQGLAEAQFALGDAYRTGEGVAEDDREAVRWFRKAAEQGFADAQYNLGVAYANGKGVAEDDREAVRWFRKAAEQGHAAAQFNLGAMYATGEGVITDWREVYIWLSLAKANGNENVATLLREFQRNRYLTQSEIRSAQKEAARRLEEIDRRKAAAADAAKDSSANAFARQNIPTTPAPKVTNPAAAVFENTWRSVVVVMNGDSQGSGVIIRPNVVATNCHVVESGGGVVVHKAVARRADTETAFRATIRRADREKDLCLLDVANLWGVVANVRKYDTLRVGEDVYGLGAPQGFDLSLSDGVISQLREAGGARFIQTNAAISPGSSGGGLFDNAGNLVGILTAKIVEQGTEGIGFAIPADLVLGE